MNIGINFILEYENQIRDFKQKLDTTNSTISRQDDYDKNTQKIINIV